MTINLNLVEIQDFFHTGGRVSIKTIKRTPIAVTSKKPYVDGANSSGDGGVELGRALLRSITRLIVSQRSVAKIIAMSC